MATDSSSLDSSSLDSTPWADLPAEQALPRLLEEHGGRIYRLATKLCGNPTDAEDLVQDVFLQAFRKWHQFQGDSSPTTWLYTIAARACQRRKRRRAGEPAHFDSLSDSLSDSPDGSPAVGLSRSPMEGPVLDVPAEADPLDDQLRREAREAVEAALVTLPMHFRLAVVLKDIVELTTPEIARILGLKPATVKTRVHRARLMIRDYLLHRSELPTKDAPPTIYSKRICMDLLTAKQEAIDRGVPFPVPHEEVCVRCEAFFDGLDFTRDVCRILGHGELPEPLRETLLDAFETARAR